MKNRSNCSFTDISDNRSTKAILTHTGLQPTNGFVFSTAIKGDGFANSREHQHIQQFSGIK